MRLLLATSVLNASLLELLPEACEEEPPDGDEEADWPARRVEALAPELARSSANRSPS